MPLQVRSLECPARVERSWCSIGTVTAACRFAVAPAFRTWCVGQGTQALKASLPACLPLPLECCLDASAVYSEFLASI